MSDERKLTPVERIFARLTTTYLADWTRKIGQTPIADMMTLWEHELSGFLQNRESMMAIGWALENLPERVPNVIEFKNLCRQAPSTQMPKLEVPKFDPEIARMAIESLRQSQPKAAP